MDLQSILAEIQTWPTWITYAILFVGSFIEYVLPPVPGDTIVVAGAVLVGAFGWSLAPIMIIVTLGAIAGATLDYYIGLWMARTGKLTRLRPGAQAAVDDIVRRFRRHGPVYLVVNRFLPGIRAFFFIAAGLAGLRLSVVLIWSTISALAWNALLVGIGYSLGHNLEALESFLSRYNTVMWILIGGIVLFFGWRMYRKVNKRPEPTSIVEGQSLEGAAEGDGAEEVDQDAPGDAELDPAGDGPPTERQ